MKNLLIVGGATRNVGKTTFVVNLLKKFGKNSRIISLKIKTIYPDDNFFHGKDENPLKENEKYRIREINITDNNQDAERMLKAGAHTVIYIKSKIKYLEQAFNEFIKNADNNILIICESNSLRFVIKPAIYLFLKMNNTVEMKPSAEKLINLADKVILSDGQKHDFNFNLLRVNEYSWQLLKE
ncbi:MAG: hypothetical protein GXO80_07215 [Chlorobi bacterium]|nr:hypothetical protein [Chlorobiota bacterium]